jgi:hypothetical protein
LPRMRGTASYRTARCLRATSSRHTTSSRQPANSASRR